MAEELRKVTVEGDDNRIMKILIIIVAIVLLSALTALVLLVNTVSNEIEDRGNSECINACVREICAEKRCLSAERMAYQDKICKGQCREETRAEKEQSGAGE